VSLLVEQVRAGTLSINRPRCASYLGSSQAAAALERLGIAPVVAARWRRDIVALTEGLYPFGAEPCARAAVAACRLLSGEPEEVHEDGYRLALPPTAGPELLEAAAQWVACPCSACREGVARAIEGVYQPALAAFRERWHEQPNVWAVPAALLACRIVLEGEGSVRKGTDAGQCAREAVAQAGEAEVDAAIRRAVLSWALGDGHA
jgi:hypothetical protein